MSTTPPPPGSPSARTLSLADESRPTAAESQPTAADPHAMTLTADEREHVTAVTEAYADALADGRAAPYRALAATAAGGSVPGDLIPFLERVCELSLETGKARDLGRAEAERVLMAVFGRTPRGRSMLHAIEAVNQALGALAGRRLRSVKASMPLPGRYVLSVQTEDVDLRVQVGTRGVTVESLAAG